MLKLKVVNTLIFICSITILFIYCEDDKSTQPPSESNLVGKWHVSSMSWDGPSETGSYNQEELDSIGVIWNINLNSDNSAEQITNLSGPITSQPGTWETNDGKLILRLKAPTSDEIGVMDFQYTLENNILTLVWTIAAGTINNSAEFIKE